MMPKEIPLELIPENGVYQRDIVYGWPLALEYRLTDGLEWFVDTSNWPREKLLNSMRLCQEEQVYFRLYGHILHVVAMFGKLRYRGLDYLTK